MLRLIRHAKSTANGSAAIVRGNPNAELCEEGLRQLPDLKQRIEKLVGGRALATIPANVTELYRTKQTAFEVGFRILQTVPLLNESSEAAPLKVLIPKMKLGWLPLDVLTRAEVFLNQPDMHAEFNFSHGLTIAACRYVAGERPSDGNMLSLVPFYAELVEIPT